MEASSPDSESTTSTSFDNAVSKAGPGIAAQAAALLILLTAVSRLLSFIDNPGSSPYAEIPLKTRFYSAFSPSSLGLVGLLLIAAVLISKTSTVDTPNLDKKQLLSVTGMVGLVLGIVMMVSTVLGLTIDANNTKIALLLSDIGWTVLVLATSLWTISESRNT